MCIFAVQPPAVRNVTKLMENSNLPLQHFVRDPYMVGCPSGKIWYIFFRIKSSFVSSAEEIAIEQTNRRMDSLLLLEKSGANQPRATERN